MTSRRLMSTCRVSGPLLSRAVKHERTRYANGPQFSFRFLPFPPSVPGCREVGRDPRSLQEAIGYPSVHNWSYPIGLILSIIAEHMCQYLSIDDAAGRRDEGTEILLAVESVAQADALGGEMRFRRLLKLLIFLPLRGRRSPALPPLPHSITSSARARSEGGIVRPRALAVLRLSINCSREARAAQHGPRSRH